MRANIFFYRRQNVVKLSICTKYDSNLVFYISATTLKYGIFLKDIQDKSTWAGISLLTAKAHVFSFKKIFVLKNAPLPSAWSFHRDEYTAHGNIFCVTFGVLVE